ncbi:hypothetical protein D9M73_147110 [compost metagenome]
MIGDDQIERLTARQPLFCLCRGADLNRLIAEIFQHVGGCHAHHRLVIDQQRPAPHHGHGAALRDFDGGCGEVGRGADREDEIDPRTEPNLTGDVHRSAKL